MTKLLSIIIPAYNEEPTISKILTKVSEIELLNDFKKEIVIVDDCSSDKTIEIAEKFIENNTDTKIKIFKHEKNSGKGMAIKTGIKECTGDYIIIQDADLEYDPEDYNKLLIPVIKDSADVVYGSRFIGGNPHRILFYWHSIGNRFLTRLSNMFTNLNLTDMETGYKLFRSDILKNIKLKENRFGFEPEVTAKIAKLKKVKIYEVGISYYGRTYEEGKKINAKDGFRALWCILKYNIFS